MRVKIPEFQTKKDRFEYLIQNKSRLIEQKKSMPIKSDPVYFGSTKVFNKGENAFKSNEPVLGDLDTLRVKVAANASNWIDGHKDMLLPGAAMKSIKERKGIIPHLHDHIHELDAELGDVVDIYYQTLSLIELGFNSPGSTDVLVFITDLIKSYNPKVFEKYQKGKIKQHSIGLQYMKLELCINDSDYEKEQDFWNKYYPQVINKDVADEDGYFWIVPEFKLIENSAVLFGSNILTPTLDNDYKKIEPDNSTHGKAEPLKDTQMLNELNKLLNIIKN